MIIYQQTKQINKLFIAILMALSILLTPASTYANNHEEDLELFKLFLRVFGEVEDKYVDEVDKNDPKSYCNSNECATLKNYKSTSRETKTYIRNGITKGLKIKDFDCPSGFTKNNNKYCKTTCNSLQIKTDATDNNTRIDKCTTCPPCDLDQEAQKASEEYDKKRALKGETDEEKAPLNDVQRITYKRIWKQNKKYPKTSFSNLLVFY